MVPDPGNGYVARPAVETAIADALAASPCAVVAGLGGSGKSQCAAAVAAAQRAQYDLVIWHDASQLNDWLVMSTSYRHSQPAGGVPARRGTSNGNQVRFRILADTFLDQYSRSHAWRSGGFRPPST